MKHPERRRPVYRFGPFTVDTAQGLLSAGPQEIPLGGKAFETLTFLIENAGRVVTKEELIDHVWPDSHVDDNNLAQNISSLRKALAAFDGTAEYIQTLPRRGYRFAAELERAEEAAPEPTAP